MGKTKEKFSWKAFISMGLFYSFLIILITGIILYLAPVGRVARWIDWHLIALSKKDWEAIHTVFSFVFVVFSILHLFFINWKSFWSYLKNKTKKGLHRKIEFYSASLFSVLIFMAIIFSIPPFNSVMDFSNYLTDSWEDKNNLPPVEQVELLTLNDLSKQINNSNIELIEQKLKTNNITFNSPDETLLEIGEKNNISIQEIYTIITSSAIPNVKDELSVP